MNAAATAIGLAERLPLPDLALRAGIDRLVGRTARQLSGQPDAVAAFARAMDGFPVAEHTDAANAQHYELPPEFFRLVLGPRRKYSSCLYPSGTESLAQAEEAALAHTLTHAGLRDGQSILELGCGWGSLTLYMAERLPGARILAVSNSRPQRAAILELAALRGLSNVEVVTADMNDFDTPERFDRIVSVEMFEHMANWRALLERARGWLTPEGRLFLHVFAHRAAPYRFDRTDPADWIARHFFTGGIMPSHDLAGCFPDLFAVEQQWRWSGHHYRRTAEHWLANFDRNRAAIAPILEEVYGADAGLWRRRWRLFFLATAGLFGHGDGSEWGVSHFVLRPAA